MQGLVRVPELNPNIKAKIVQSGKKGFSEERTAPTAAGTQSIAAAEQAQKCSQFVLKEFGSPWPSVENIKKSARSEWTIPAVKHRIAELKRIHRQQLAKAIKYQECEYAQMMMDEYSAFDTDADFTENLKSFLRMDQHLQAQKSDNFVSSLRYSHIIALKPLYERLQRLLVVEERAKQQRARRFPKSSQGWREMDTRDAKLKVAKFLMLDKKKQDEMILREADWRADRADVDKVVSEYSTSIMFTAEVKAFVKESQTTDPRRRA